MPELPEVENTLLSLKDVINNRITSLHLSGKNLREKINFSFKDVVGLSIESIERRAKYLLFHLSNKSTLLVHLGMSGSFSYTDNLEIDKHDHVVLYFSNGMILKYNDPRRFGLFIKLDFEDINENKYLKQLALDGIDKDFTYNYLQDRLKKTAGTIKSALLNQGVVAGLGNIYVSEVLHTSRISPLRLAKMVSECEINILVDNIKEVLNLAISKGGSTLKDYKKANGEKGEFQKYFLVYAKEGSKCEFCEERIVKITQNGRATFYCNGCQH